MFEKKIYTERRKQLMAQFTNGILVFTGNVEQPINYPGNVWPFRQDSTFLYYFGIDLPGLNAIIDIDAQETILFGDDLTIDDVIWMGSQPALANLAAQTGIARIEPSQKFVSFLQEASAQKRPIHYLPQYQHQAIIRLAEALGKPWQQINTEASVPFIKAVIAQRSHKQAEEIQQIEEALKITYEAHLQAMKLTKPGIREHFVAGKVQGEVYKYGVLLSFPLIFTVRGEILHNAPTSRTMQEGQLALCDLGAESALHYAGDITRTFPVSGKFSPQQKEIYEIVLQAQLTAINSVAPGVKYRDIHLKAAEVIVEGLQQVGLMQGDVQAAVQEGAHALFFPHGLGHMMGLDVHDMEGLGEDLVGYDNETQRSTQFGLAYLRLGKALEPGYVLTVEPGIYFIPPLMDLWESQGKHRDFIRYDRLKAFREFGGIRIEDDVLVTSQGHRVLGQPIAKTVDEIETVMQG